MGLISILLFIFGFLAYFNRQKYITLIVIALLSTSYFGFFNNVSYIGPISIQHGDFALLLIFSLLPFRTKIHNTQLRGINRALSLFFIFLVVSIFYDFFMRDTSAMQIFRTTRELGYLAFFLLIQSFKYDDYKKLIIPLAFFTVFHSFLYISQYVFDYSLSGNSIENELGGMRYGGIPPYIIPVFIIVLFDMFRSRNMKLLKHLVIVVFCIAILLSQGRGLIISAIAVFYLYMYLKDKARVNVVLLTLPLFFVGFILVQAYFPIISERFMDLYSQTGLVRDMDYTNLQFFFHEGSFIFRWGVTYERFMHVIEEPMRMVLGVGFIPDIDIVSPIFTLGTHSPMLPTGFEQYNSVDIMFPNIITRYGIMGSLIFLYLLLQLFKFSFRIKYLQWGGVLFTYLCSMLFISSINESFYNGKYFFLIFVIIGLTISASKKSTLSANLQ